MGNKKIECLCNNEVIENLIGNADGSLDHFLLYSVDFTQEDREIIMEAIFLYLEKACRIKL